MTIPVIANTSFVSTIDGIKYRVQQDDELGMPDGADWLQAGLVRRAAPEKKTKTARRRTKKVSEDGS